MVRLLILVSACAPSGVSHRPVREASAPCSTAQHLGKSAVGHGRAVGCCNIIRHGRLAVRKRMALGRPCRSLMHHPS